MEKENYPLQSASTEKPNQDDTSDFDLYGEHDQDQAYLEAMLGSDAEVEKSETEKMPEAAEDQSY